MYPPATIFLLAQSNHQKLRSTKATKQANRGVKAMLKTQEIYEVASELLAGTILDMDQITANDTEFISDILARQDFALRIVPELSVVYAVPESYLH